MATSQDTSQLILQVDASIALAQRNLRSLSQSVATESGNIEKSLARVDTAHQKMGASFGNSRVALMEVQHVAKASADQFAAGTPILQIFTQHLAQLSQAASFAGDGMGKFGAFLAGPWGIALTLATVVLAKLAMAHEDNSKSVAGLVQKMREQADQAGKNREADDIWKRSVEGVTEAIRKQNEEQEKALRTDAAVEQASLRQAKDRLDRIARERTAAAANLDAAERERTARAKQFNVDLPAFQQRRAIDPKYEIYGLGQLTDKVDAARAKLQGLVAVSSDARDAIRGAEASIAERQASYATDASKKVNDYYDNQVLKAKLAARSSDELTAALKRTLTQIEKNRAAKLAEIADAKKSHADENRQSGRQVSFAQASSIAQAAGFQVNSGYRSPAEQARLFNDPSVNRPGNPVAAPGSSAHNGANGKWAIDIQITDGVTPGKIRKVFADQGVSLTKVLKEKGHFHVEGSRSEAASAENKAAAEAKRQLHDNNQFGLEMDSASRELLSVQRELIGDYHLQEGFAKQIVEQDKKRAEDAIAAKVSEGTLTAEQGKALNLVQEQIADQKLKNIAIKGQVHDLQTEDELRAQAAGFQQDDLRAQDAMAKTQAEHRKIQMEIVDILYQEKQRHLESLKAEAEKAGLTQEAAKIQAEINHLPTERANAQQSVTQGTQGPLQSFLQNIPHTADQINEAMQNLEVQGINGVADSLVALSGGFDNFRQVALSAIKDVLAQLIRMQIMKAIFNIAGSAASSPGTMGGGEFASAFGTGGSAYNLPHLASGGSFEIGGNDGIDRNVLQINGRPMAMVGRGETLAVIPKEPRISIPRRNANDNGGGMTIHAPFNNYAAMDERTARRTALQHASIVRGEINRATTKGA